MAIDPTGERFSDEDRTGKTAGDSDLKVPLGVPDAHLFDGDICITLDSYSGPVTHGHSFLSTTQHEDVRLQMRQYAAF